MRCSWLLFACQLPVASVRLNTCLRPVNKRDGDDSPLLFGARVRIVCPSQWHISFYCSCRVAPPGCYTAVTHWLVSRLFRRFKCNLKYQVLTTWHDKQETAQVVL